MKITITVEVDVAHVRGKFASKDEIAELIIQAIDDADPGEINTGDDADYSIASWEAFVQ